MLDPAFVRMAREAPYLALDAERELVARAQSGDQQAKDKLFASHYRLILQEASRRSGYKIGLEDLVQEGVAGMTQALKRFDAEQKVRFATYASWWIRRSMNDAAILDHSVVRRNTTRLDKALFFNLRRAYALLERGNLFTKQEIYEQLAERFGTNVADIASMSAYLGTGDRALDAPLPNADHDDGTSFGDMLVDPSPRPDEIAEARVDNDHLYCAIARSLAALSPREERIIRARRYVDDPSDAKSLEELGGELGLSRERVRQIEERAMRKLARSLRAQGVGPRNLS